MARYHHFCNEPFRCWTCYIEFLRWAQVRTHQPARPGQPNFYTCVNNVSPPVQVTAKPR